LASSAKSGEARLARSARARVGRSFMGVSG